MKTYKSEIRQWFWKCLMVSSEMKFLTLVFLFAVAFAKHEQYKGWKSYIISTPTKDAQSTFTAISEAYQVDVLSPPIVQREGVVIVRPEYQEGFVKALEKFNIEYKVHRNDLKTAFDHDDMVVAEQRNATRSRSDAGKMAYDNYQNFEVINAYLEDVARRFPDIVTLVNPANSFEGRPIKYLKISTTNFQDPRKPVIFIDGGIHSREWISPPTVTYAIKRLVEDRAEPDLLDRFDWILLPVVNPDGYEFTWTNDRMWRMTRSTDQHLMSSLCPGVDGNRNYDFAWNTVGTSSTPCGFSQTYAGGRAFSEIETSVVRDIILENLNRMALYITMHSFGSMILYPWGHDGSLSNNAFALQIVGNAIAQRIDSLSLSNFPNYVVGNSVLVIGYPAAGASEDYAHSVGVPLSFTIELPGLGWLASQGFHLNPIYIEHVCMETWEGLVIGARRAGDLFGSLKEV